MSFGTSVCPKKPIFKSKIEHNPFFFFGNFDKTKWHENFISVIDNTNNLPHHITIKIAPHNIIFRRTNLQKNYITSKS